MAAGMPSAGIALSTNPTSFLPVSLRALAVRMSTRDAYFDCNEGVQLMVRNTHPEPGDPAAGNGILSRRIFLEGALVVGATRRGPVPRIGRTACGAAMDEGAGSGVCGLRPALTVREQGCQSLSATPKP